MRKFLHDNLKWSLRKGTWAGQKVPADAEAQMERAFLRAAAAIRDEAVPACCFVNCDQTNCVYSHGASSTYTPRGSNQVPIAQMDEKRAFTLMVGVSMDGDVLPFQAIYQGSDPKRSLPKTTSSGYDEAESIGIQFEVSKTRTYWSTQGTMQSYVTHILVPYFERQKVRLGLPDQLCIWLLDIYAVHRSLEF